MINRWGKDTLSSNDKGLSVVWEAGIVISANVKKKKEKKSELPRPEFLEPKQRLEEQEKATVIHRFTVLGL